MSSSGSTQFDDESELVQEFRNESIDHLQDVEPCLLRIESNPTGPETSELVNRVFRAVHSVKGTAGFFGFEAIERLSHAMESLMMDVRDGVLAYRQDMSDALLSGADALSQMIEPLPKRVEVPVEDLTKQLAALRDPDAASSAMLEVSAPSTSAEASVDTSAIAAANSDAPSEPSAYPKMVLPEAVEEARSRGHWVFEVSGPQQAERLDSAEDLGLILAANSDFFVSATPLEPDLFAAALGLEIGFVKTVMAVDENPPVKPAPAAEAVAPAAQSQKASKVESESVRVNVGLLNKLMNLAGELVLARNQVFSRIGDSEDVAVRSSLKSLGNITSELQTSIMQTRMQPMETIFKKLPRVVRDVSRKLGKQVEVEVNGGDVELDKSIVELLNDPLTHLVRNGLDHGLEGPSERESRGKSPTGRLTVGAFHEGGQVHIEIRDDGRGIDPQKVRAVAVKRGVVSDEESRSLSESQLRNLIFAPGFSTAEKITDVSGRGVGMDVVKVNIDRLGGRIHIESEVGKGTAIQIRLPLTLAIIPALVVQLADKRYALPGANLVELVRITPDDAPTMIQDVAGSAGLRLRQRLLPLIRLENVLDCPRDEAGCRTRFAAILRAGPSRFALMVDRVLDSEEIVVKPLSSHLSSSRVYAGSTIMGDGQVAMILDANGIAAVAKMETLEEEVAEEGSINGDAERSLIFETADNERYAVELSQVGRVERFETESVERVGTEDVLQTKTGAVDLLRPERFLNAGVQVPEHPRGFIIVPKSTSRPIGLVAARIVDTAPLRDIQETATPRRGVRGRAVVAGRVTTVLDIDTLGLDASDSEPSSPSTQGGLA